MFTIFPTIVMSDTVDGTTVRHICTDGTMIRVSTNTSFGTMIRVSRDGRTTSVEFGRDGSVRTNGISMRPRGDRDGRFVNDGSGCVVFDPTV